jgi:hypothetical protein
MAAEGHRSVHKEGFDGWLAVVLDVLRRSLLLRFNDWLLRFRGLMCCCLQAHYQHATINHHGMAPAKQLCRRTEWRTGDHINQHVAAVHSHDVSKVCEH